MLSIKDKFLDCLLNILHLQWHTCKLIVFEIRPKILIPLFHVFSGKLRLITGLDLIQGIPLQGNHYRELLQGMIDGAEIMLDGRYKQKDKKGTSSPNPLYYFYIGEQSVK